jgi:2-polyprenyl-3-methyl-5-hydroxy-6-metoxy-1,4-benzoquinol methylase
VSGRQWQVVGSAAQVYQRELVPAIFGPWAPRVVALASPAAGERVLDVACGTGVLEDLEAALAAWQDADGPAFPIEALLVGGRTVSPGG